MNHPQANIHPGAKIADGVEIMPFATIEDDVVIGEGTKIYPNAVVMRGARIGKNVRIFPGAVISGEPQDLKFQGEDSTLEIGDNTVVREFVTISRGTAADDGRTVIGKNCLLMAYTHVAHDCKIGDNCILVNAVQVAGHVSIDNHAIIGGTSAVHQFVHVGAHVMVSGGSLVRKDIPPYVTAGREPLAYCGVNSIGLRRRGYSSDKIQEIQEIYRIIYQSGLNNSKALDQIIAEFPQSEERDKIVEFVRASDRGILRGLFQ